MGDFSVTVTGFGSNSVVDGKADGTASWWGNFGAGYSGDWGKKPKSFEVNPDLAGLSIYDLLESAKAGFNAIKVPTEVKNPHTGKYVTSTETFQVVRDDTFQEIGPRIGPDYTVVQHGAALEHIIGDVRELGGVPTRVLSFNGGRRVLIQCALPATFWVAGAQHGLFLNVWNSHDGLGGVGGNACDFRVICANTYAMAKKSALSAFFTKHTKNVADRLKKLSAAVGILRQEYEDYGQALFNLGQREVDGAIMDQFLKALLPDPVRVEGEVKRQNAGPETRRKEIAQAILAGSKNQGKLTAYDLFQGVTGVVDRREQNRNESEQVAYALEGQGQKLKDAAWAILTA